MNFAIEAPAEANPLTARTLLHVLQSASSSDRQQVQSGAKQLQNWERSPGFYSSLQSLYIDYSLPVELRYLAIIQLKNGIDKYWRKTATNAIRKEEKDIIRRRSIESCIAEPDARLALQISVLIAKIIRHEYPHDWPDAIGSIVENLNRFLKMRVDASQPSRTLLLLLCVVKELSTAKLQRSRVNLQSVAPEIIEILSLMYLERVTTWMDTLQNQNDREADATELMEQSLISLRILRRLIIAAYDFPNRERTMFEIWNLFKSQLEQFFELTLSEVAGSSKKQRPLIEKHALQVAKLHLDMVRSHPAGFALLPNTVVLVKAYWTLISQCAETYGCATGDAVATKIGTHGDVESEGIPFIEKLSLKGLLIIRACVKMVFNPAQTFKYQRDEDKEEKNASKELVRNSLVTEDFARQVMNTVVTRFFIFTPRDLKEWEEEPDEWEKSQEGGGEDWEFSIRTCSEKLFLDLVIHFKESLVQPLIQVFKSVADVQNFDVMLKDSIYAAVGLAAPVLEQYPELDVGEFLQSTLAQEVQIQRQGYNILRRRAAIWLGQWLPVKEGLNRPLVYQMFQHLLTRGDQLNDQVVRVTAARQLKNVIDPFEFRAEQFTPYIQHILGSMMALTEETELPETKIAILGTIGVIVNKMEQAISPFADHVISLLPPLWEGAGEEYLLKQTILGILSSLCASMQADSRRYHPLIIPLIQSSIEPSSETRVYLLEEALDLWTIVLTQTPSDHILPELLRLVQYIFPLFEVASENLRKALEITGLYVHLIPSEMTSNAISILNPLVAILGNLKRDASGMVTDLAELMIRSAESLGKIHELIQGLIMSQLLCVILSGLDDAYQANLTTGPSKRHAKIDGVVETDYLNVLARLAIKDPRLFISAVDATSYEGQIQSVAQVSEKMDRLLTEWIDHLDMMSQPTDKKLNVLALTSLLETGQPWILNRLQSLMSEWTSAVTDLVIDTSLDPNVVDNRDSLVYNDPEVLKSEGAEAPADERRRTLTFRDPVHRIDIRDHIRQKLAIAVEVCGGMESFQRDWVQNVDADVVGAFSALGVV